MQIDVTVELTPGMLFYLILVQERLTRQIAEAVLKAIDPRGVGVIVEAS
jgi:GTP cyclohydrolase I